MPARIRSIFALLLVMALVVAAVGGYLLLAGRPAAVSSAKAIRPNATEKEKPPPTPKAEDPSADLDDPRPNARMAPLNNRTRLDEWARGPNATPERLAAAAARIRKAFGDSDSLVRVSAAEFVEGGASFPGFKREEAVPVCETLLADPLVEVRTRAAVIVWRYKGTPETGQVLVAAVEDRHHLRDGLRMTVVPTDAPPRRYPDGIIPAAERVIADRREEVSLRYHLLADLRQAMDAGAKPSAGFEKVAAGLLADDTDDPQVRGLAVAVLAKANGGVVPPAVRPTAAKLAANPKTPVPLRVRLIAALNPRSNTFATEHNEIANQLDAAITDTSADPAFRAFAAHFFTPDTPGRFVRAVAVMADTDTAAVTLRRVLAERTAAYLADHPLPVGEAVTIPLAQMMAACPSVAYNPRILGGYAPDTGELWEILPWNATGSDFEAKFVPVLVKADPQVLPAIADGLGNELTRERSLTVLLKRGDAAKEADRIAAHLAVFDFDDEDRKLAAEVAKGLSGSKLAEWLRANMPAHQRRAELVKDWKAAGKDPIPPLLGLFTHERADVRAWAAEEVGKIGPDAKAAVPKLAEQLVADKSSTEPYVAALAAVGPDSLPALTDLIGHKEPRVRGAAAEAFGRLGPEVRSKATPVLRGVIEGDKDPAVKAAALTALGRVNPDAAKSLGWTGR